MSIELVAGTPMVGGALGIAAVAVWLSARREFLLKFLSFAAATPILVLASSTGLAGTTTLAAGLAVICCWEFARMAAIPLPQAVTLTCTVLTAIFSAAAGHPSTLAWLLLPCAVVSLLAGRPADRSRHAALAGWGVLWLGGTLSQLPALGGRLMPVAVAVSLGDVAAYFGGALANRAAARHAWCAARLSVLSPNKTWCGAITGGGAAILVLALLHGFTLPAVLAVTFGAVLGDLVESMVKRGCGVKDAGAWLPGFGGLLDRVDSLLGALLVVGLFA